MLIYDLSSAVSTCHMVFSPPNHLWLTFDVLFEKLFDFWRRSQLCHVELPWNASAYHVNWSLIELPWNASTYHVNWIGGVGCCSWDVYLLWIYVTCLFLYLTWFLVIKWPKFGLWWFYCADICDPCADRATVWASGDRSNASASWWKPCLSSLPGLGSGTNIFEDMDEIGKYIGSF